MSDTFKPIEFDGNSDAAYGLHVAIADAIGSLDPDIGPWDIARVAALAAIEHLRCVHFRDADEWVSHELDDLEMELRREQ